MQELRDCPFCGDKPVIKEVVGRSYVYCARNECVGPCAEMYSKGEAAAAWNRRADDADRARLVAQAEELQARVTELESAIVIDRGVFNRLCTLQAIMEHPTAMPSAEEFNEYTGLLELVFHRHDKEAADNV